MNSAFHQGTTLWEDWITPVEAISGQPQKERLAYKLVDKISFGLIVSHQLHMSVSIWWQVPFSKAATTGETKLH